MRTWRVSFIALVLPCLVAVPNTALPCTTFLLNQDGPVVGKSYDWSLHDGLVLINKRNVKKVAITFETAQVSAEWISKYQSVTFNQYGRELPNSGMNEKGLVVEVMWLDSSIDEPTDSRPTVNELQWLQRSLDLYASVAELVAELPSVRIVTAFGRLHYLACDATLACAAIELVSGELVVSTGASLPVATLTNNTYADSLDYLSQFEGFGGTHPLPSGSGSLPRFARAASLSQNPTEATGLDSAVAVLDSVSQGSFSKWNLIYFPSTRRVYFRTYNQPTLKWLGLSKFDPSCDTPVMALDIDSPLEGSVTTAFVPYTSELNDALLDKTVGPNQAYLPNGTLAVVQRYPETTVCQNNVVQEPTDTTHAATTDNDAGGCKSQPGSMMGALLVVSLLVGRRRTQV